MVAHRAGKVPVLLRDRRGRRDLVLGHDSSPSAGLFRSIQRSSFRGNESPTAGMVRQNSCNRTFVAARSSLSFRTRRYSSFGSSLSRFRTATTRAAEGSK